MFYAVYNPDTGRIDQANKIFDDVSDGRVEDLMRDMGQKWVSHPEMNLVSPELWYVDTKKVVLTERKPLEIVVDRTVIKAGDNDAAIFTNIPKGAKLLTICGTSIIHNLVMPETSLELSIPVPCTYKVRFEFWPYRNAEFEVEAVA